MYYIYRHIRLDTEETFYIGKGQGKRAYRKSGRNYYWQNIVNKVGYRIEILKKNLEEDYAYALEERLIQFYKRRNQCMANLSLGKGSKGLGMPEHIKKLIKKANTGRKHSEETKYKISRANKGKRRTEEEKQKMSESCKRRSHPNNEGLLLSHRQNIAKSKGAVEFSVFEKDSGKYIGT